MCGLYNIERIIRHAYIMLVSRLTIYNMEYISIMIAAAYSDPGQFAIYKWKANMHGWKSLKIIHTLITNHFQSKRYCFNAFYVCVLPHKASPISFVSFIISFMIYLKIYKWLMETVCCVCTYAVPKISQLARLWYWPNNKVHL